MRKDKLYIYFLLIYLPLTKNVLAGTDCKVSESETDVMGIPPVKAVVGNGKITAGFSDGGKLVTLFYPSVGAYDLVPYITTTDKNDKFYGSPDYMGAFIGLVKYNKSKADINWLWSGNTMSHSEEYPSFTFTYNLEREKISISNNIFAPIESKSVIYNINISNNGTEDKNLGIAFYGFFDPISRNQNPSLKIPIGQVNLWQTDGYARVARIGGTLIWYKEGINSYAIGVGSNLPEERISYIDAGVADIPTISSIPSINKGIFNNSYEVQNATKDGEVWKNIVDLTPYAMNGIIIWDLGRIPSRGSTSLKIVLAVGDKKDEVINIIRSSSNIDSSNTRRWWGSFLQKINDIGKRLNLSDSDLEKLKWWAITMRLMVDSNTGAISASPLLIPKYYGSWPRDGIFQTIVWIALGYNDIARNYFKFLFNHYDFKNEGRWYQCYDTNKGEYVGFPWKGSIPELGLYNDKVLEEDQMSLVIMGLWYYYKTFNELPISEKDFRKLADYILSSILDGEGEEEKKIQIKFLCNDVCPEVIKKYCSMICNGNYQININIELLLTIKNGLVRPSSDAYEFPGEISSDIGNISRIKECYNLIASRQSAYTNLAAVSALKAAYDILKDEKYNISACLLRKKTEKIFYSNDHFKVAWSIFTKDLYDRQEDLSTAIGWPIQAYNINNDKIVSHFRKIRDMYDNPEQNRKIFVPGILLTDIYGNLINDKSNFFEKIEDTIEAGNGYLPERIEYKDQVYVKVPSAEPLGWSMAMGIMDILTRAGYKPPILEDKCENNAEYYYIFLIDCSGSMNDNGKIQQVKKAIPQIINDLPIYKSNYAVIAYSGRYGCSPEQTPVIVPFTNDVEKVKNAVESMTADGSTPMRAGLERAYSYANLIPDDKPGMIILLADGQQNCPDGNLPPLENIIIKRMIVRNPKVTLSTVGYDINDNSTIESMQRLAKEGGGTYIDARNPNVVKGKFRELILSKTIPEIKMVNAGIYMGALSLFLLLTLL